MFPRSSCMVISSGRLWLPENWAWTSTSLQQGKRNSAYISNSAACTWHPTCSKTLHQLLFLDPFPSHLRSGMAVSKSWKVSGRVMVATAASLFSSGKSTTPGLKTALIHTNAQPLRTCRDLLETVDCRLQQTWRPSWFWQTLHCSQPGGTWPCASRCAPLPATDVLMYAERASPKTWYDKITSQEKSLLLLELAAFQHWQKCIYPCSTPSVGW